MKKNILLILSGIILGFGLSQAPAIIADSIYYNSSSPLVNASWVGPTAAPSFSKLAKAVKPAIVNIQTTKLIQKRQNSPFFRFGPRSPFDDFFEEMVPKEQRQSSLGSGFIINKDGYILTNNHVIEKADEIIVFLVDGRKLNAEIVGTDSETDLAVIKIKSPGDLPVVPLGDSEKSEPGEWVMAIGNPFGLEHTVTVGVLSAKGRVVPGDTPYRKFLQTDASINPGNSGGPLLNAKGEVIGINTMIYGMGTGIGFAIPINLAKDLVPQLISKGSVSRGWLGVGMQEVTEELAKSFGLEKNEGVLIREVMAGSPAEKSGLMQGDIITKLNNETLKTTTDLAIAVGRTPAGKTIDCEIIRDGKKQKIKVRVGEKEKQTEVANKNETKSNKDADKLGLIVRNLRLDEQQGSKTQGGVIIQRVEPGSAAENSDIHQGDILLEVNGDEIKNVDTYQKQITQLKKGAIVRLLLKRGNFTIYVAFNLR